MLERFKLIKCHGLLIAELLDWTDQVRNVRQCRKYFSFYGGSNGYGNHALYLLLCLILCELIFPYLSIALFINFTQFTNVYSNLLENLELNCSCKLKGPRLECHFGSSVMLLGTLNLLVT